MIKPLHFCVPGRMVNKKNHIRPWMKGGRLFIDHTPEWKAYETIAVHAIKKYWGEQGKPLDYLSEVQAVKVTVLYFIPDRNRPDLSAIFETVGDLIEKAGVIWNDRQILSWGISRIMDVDKAMPGLFIKVEPYQPGPGEFVLWPVKRPKKKRRHKR